MSRARLESLAAEKPLAVSRAAPAFRGYFFPHRRMIAGHKRARSNRNRLASTNRHQLLFAFLKPRLAGIAKSKNRLANLDPFAKSVCGATQSIPGTSQRIKLRQLASFGCATR